MTRKKKKGPAPARDMAALLAMLGEKTLGNLIELSANLDASDDTFKFAIDKLAEGLIAGCNRMGYIPVRGSGKAYVRFPSDDPMYSRSSVAMKMRTVFNADPARFVCFAATVMSEAQDARSAAERVAMQTRMEMGRIHQVIASATTLDEVRALIVERGDDLP